MSVNTVLCLECFTENNTSYKECWRCHKPLNPNLERTNNGIILGDWNIFFSVVTLEWVHLCKPLTVNDLAKYSGLHYDCGCGARLVFNPRDHMYSVGLLWRLPENRIAFPSIHGNKVNKCCGMLCLKITGFGIWKKTETVFLCPRPEVKDEAAA